MNKTEQQWFKD